MECRASGEIPEPLKMVCLPVPPLPQGLSALVSMFYKNRPKSAARLHPFLHPLLKTFCLEGLFCTEGSCSMQDELTQQSSSMT